jgi:predicted ATP-dependent protease
MRANREVPAEQVTLRGDPDVLAEAPETTVDRIGLLPARARRALELGLSLRNPGFHVFVACDPDLMFDKDIVKAARAAADALPPPNDVVFVHDFDRPEAPKPLVLPAGRGRELAAAVDKAIDMLGAQLPHLSAVPSVREAETVLAKELSSKNKQVVSDLESFAKSLGFGVKAVPGGVQTFPILHGKPVSPEQFEVLDESTKRALADAELKLSIAVEESARRIHEMTDDVNAASDDAVQKAAEVVIDAQIESLIEAFRDIEPVVAYLDRIREELSRDWRDFTEQDQESGHRDDQRADEVDVGNPEVAKRTGRFRVNVFVSHAPGAKAPVVDAHTPSFPNLFGYLERRARFGALLTDFLRIRSGAMAHASGGYLFVRAADLLADPLIWERFKRTIRDRELAIEDPIGPVSLYATTLRPQPVPLDVRVVLIGPQHLYDQLLQVDSDFGTLFRVKVEIDWWVDRSQENQRKLDSYLMGLPTVQRMGLAYSRSARARLLDFATRLSGDRERLALTVLPLEETACFAAVLTAERNDVTVTDQDIEAAWFERRDRSRSIELEVRELALRGEFLVETTATRVGVINGLSVLSAGDVEFGQPMRITAVVSLGRDGVIDVEREAQLGGSLHTKGVAIVRGFLSHMFGQERPLSLRVQIAFEQSYGEIDGDSASSSELFAILSALADVGIDQGIAVTGSVNQLGDIQAIGGVCAKIEGFFDVCRARGLTGAQGVMIPKTNLRHLVLRPDVAEAIAQGQFHLYAISSVADGIEVLTGLPAGARDASGRFPAGSVFGRVERRLIELAELLRDAEAGPLDRGGVGESGDGDAVDAGGDFQRVYDRDW